MMEAAAKVIRQFTSLMALILILLVVWTLAAAAAVAWAEKMTEMNEEWKQQRAAEMEATTPTGFPLDG